MIEKGAMHGRLGCAEWGHSRAKSPQDAETQDKIESYLTAPQNMHSEVKLYHFGCGEWKSSRRNVKVQPVAKGAPIASVYAANPPKGSIFA